MEKIKYLPLESNLANRIIQGPILHVWPQTIDSLSGTIPCTTCTFWLEEKYQHETSKNTTRIREMGLSVCTWEGSWLTLWRNCKNTFWVCKLRKQILVLTVCTGLYWKDGWCRSRTVRPAGRLNCKLSSKCLSFNPLDTVLRFAMPSQVPVLWQDGLRGRVWPWWKYPALPVS